MPEVAVAYIHPGQVSAAFSFSLLRTFCYEYTRTGTAPYLLASKCGAGVIAQGRNKLTADFLDGDVECDWLWWVDADMGFGPDTLEQLLATADPEAAPIVGALCFGLKAHDDIDDVTQAERMLQFPTVYSWNETETVAGFDVIVDYPRNQLVKVAASGAACVLIHRTVLEKMRAEHDDNWFTPLANPKGSTFGEDMSFFIRAGLAETPVYVNTAVKTSHDKGGIFLTEESWDDQLRLMREV